MTMIMENAQLESSKSSVTLDNTSIPESSRQENAARFRKFEDNSGSFAVPSSSDISEPSDLEGEQQTVARMQDAAAPADAPPASSEEQNLKLEQENQREQATKSPSRRRRSFKPATNEQESWQSPCMRASEFTSNLTPSYRRSQLQRNASVPTFSSSNSHHSVNFSSFSNLFQDNLGSPRNNEQDNTMHSREDGSVDGDETIDNSFRPSIDKRAQLLALQSPRSLDAIEGKERVSSLPSNSPRSLDAASPRNSLHEFLDALIFDTKNNTKIDASSVDNRRGRRRQGSVDGHSSAKSVSSVPTTMMRCDKKDTSNLQTFLKATKPHKHAIGANTPVAGHPLSRKQDPDAKIIGSSSPASVPRGKDPPGKKKKKNLGGFLETRRKSGQQNPANTGEQIEQQVTVTVFDGNDEKKYTVGNKEANIIQALMNIGEVRKSSSSLVAPENSNSGTLHTKDEAGGTLATTEVEGSHIIYQSSNVHQSSKVSSGALHGFLDRKQGGRSGAHTVTGDRVSVRFGNQDRSTKEVLELLEKEQSRPKKSAVLWARKTQLSARSLQIQESIEALHESASAHLFEQDEILDSARIGPRSIDAAEKEENLNPQDFLARKPGPAKERKSGAITIPDDRVDFRALYAGKRLLSLSTSRLFNSRRNLAVTEEIGQSGTTNRRNLMKKMSSVPTLGSSDRATSPKSQTDLRLSGYLKRQGSSGSKLAGQRSAGEADSKLSSYLDKSTSKDPQPSGGRASVAGDQLTLNKKSSLTGEIYVRSDGKRVRRVRKSADGEILNRPESRTRRKRRAKSATEASQTEGESKQNTKKTWLDQYLEGEVPHHDATMSPSPAKKNNLSLKIGAIEAGSSESSLPQKVRMSKCRNSMRGSSSEFDAPGTFNRRDGMRKMKSVPTMHNPAAALVGLYDKAASNPKHRPNACESNETSDDTNSKTPPERRHSDYECVSQASPRPDRSSKKLKDLPRQGVGKDGRPTDSKKSKLLQNTNRLKKAKSCQNLGNRAYNVADRLMLVERLRSLNNDPGITSLRPRPKMDYGDGKIKPVELIQDDCKEEAVGGKQQPEGSNEEYILARPRAYMSAVSTVDAQKLQDNNGDEKATSDELQEIPDEAASSAAPPPIPVRKISNHSQPTDASVVQASTVLSPTATETKPTRPKHTRWLSVPRDLGAFLYSPARKLSVTPQSGKKTASKKVLGLLDPTANGINVAKKTPSLPFDSIHATPVEQQSEDIQSEVDDTSGPQVAAVQARPPSIPLRKTSRIPESGGNLLNSGKRSGNNPSRSALQSGACRWSSVPKNLGSVVDTSMKHQGSRNPRSKQNQKALNPSEINPGSVLELEDNDTVCSELTDSWSADVIRDWLQAQASRHGRKASLDLDSILKEEGIDVLNNSWEGLSFTPHEQKAPTVDDESILHQSKRWESSPGLVQQGVPRPERPSEPEIPKITKVQESSDRFGWLKKFPFRAPRPNPKPPC
jgi:hypothetical protein